MEFLEGVLFNTKMMICDWINFENKINQLKVSIKKKQQVIRPFAMLSLVDNPKLNKLVAEIFSNFYFTNKNYDYKSSFNKKNRY